MPITTIPVPGPSASTTDNSAANSARAKAIAILSGNAAKAESSQTEAVSNPTQVSPEEMSAVKTPEKVQKDTSKSESESSEEPKDKEEPLSSQFAVLARKEKALRAKAQQQEAAYKAREEALAAREAAIAAKDTEYQSDYIPKSRLLEDTLGTLAEAGIDYEQLTQLALNPPPKQDPATKAYIAKLEAQINKINGTLEEQSKSAKESQTQAYQQAVQQIERDVSKLVNSNEEYEAIKSTGSVKDVVKLIEKTFAEEGTMLTYEEACKEVEDYLIDKSFQLSQLKKVQQRLQGNKKPETPAVTAPQTQPEPSKQIKTLTNSVGVSRQLSSRERAILAMKGELK